MGPFMIEPSDKCSKVSAVLKDEDGWSACQASGPWAPTAGVTSHGGKQAGDPRPHHHLGRALLRPDVQSRLSWVQRNESRLSSDYLTSLSPSFL